MPVGHTDGVPPGAVRGQVGLGFDGVQRDLDTRPGVALRSDRPDQAVLLGDPEVGQGAVEISGSRGVLGQVGRRHPDPEVELPGQLDALQCAGVRPGATLSVVEARACGVQADLERHPVTVEGLQGLAAPAPCVDHRIGQHGGRHVLGGPGHELAEVGVEEGFAAGDEPLPAALLGELLGSADRGLDRHQARIGAR